MPDDAVLRYVDGWGREGDAGVIAEAGGVAVGAAWYRVLGPERPGYGFVAPGVPEIAIAVEAAWRGRGVGGLLLAALIDRAHERGVRALSLSVSTENPAVRLYGRSGFEVVRRDVGSVTMLRRFDA